MTAPVAALVTGAGRGIGRAIAVALAAAGHSVVVSARSADELASTADEIRSSGGQAVAVPADVTDPASVTALHEAALGSVGEVGIVVNNAGNLVFAPFVPLPGSDAQGALTFEQWRGVQDVHVGGAVRVLQAFAPAMLAAGRGRVVNIVSSALGRTVPLTSAYDVAKAGLAQLTRSLAYEWARHGVTVNAVAVGQVRTRMTEDAHDDPHTSQWMLRRIPVGRVGTVDDVARTVAFLSGDGAAFITGQIIGVDGGETL